MNREQALYNFFSSFGIPAYESNSVPEAEEFPHLVYELITDGFNYPVSTTVQIWYNNNSLSDLLAKRDEIESKTSSGGIMLTYDGGALWITKGSPFSTLIGDRQDRTLKGCSLNLEIEFM